MPRRKFEVEGYHDHKSAVKKVAADLDLDPRKVQNTINTFFGAMSNMLYKGKTVFFAMLGSFRYTNEASIQKAQKRSRDLAKDRKKKRDEYRRTHTLREPKKKKRRKRSDKGSRRKTAFQKEMRRRLDALRAAKIPAPQPGQELRQTGQEE